MKKEHSIIILNTRQINWSGKNLEIIINILKYIKIRFPDIILLEETKRRDTCGYKKKGKKVSFTFAKFLNFCLELFSRAMFQENLAKMLFDGSLALTEAQRR